MGPRSDLNKCRKSHPPPGFDPWPIQPVASHYTDLATRPINYDVTMLYFPSHMMLQSDQAVLWAVLCDRLPVN
jgi:hypothetical protein